MSAGLARAGEPGMTDHLLPTYKRQDVVFARGEGAWLETTDGRRFLDFGSGIAVNALGHAHPRLVEALTEQAARLWHVSNLYRIAGQERLAERLCEVSFADRVFFANSGAEAVECAIKMARRYHWAAGAPERTRLITFEGAFHGRTLATLAAGGQAKYLEGYGAPVGGFDQVAFGDVEAVASAIGPETAGLLIEPIQGEGGVRVLSRDALRALRDLCNEHGLLLVLDEVQTGFGRTGTLFAHERAGIAPDIMAVAKGIGGGFPLGACLATEKAARAMTAGSHASTFGGNPLAMAVGNAVLDVLLEPGFLARIEATSSRLRQGLAHIKDAYDDLVAEIRGEGLLLGIKLRVLNTELVAAAFAEGLLVIGAGDNVVRTLPPLNIGESEAAEGLARLEAALRRLREHRREDRP